MPHALLSASSAYRWMHCPPSARLTERMKDTASLYAAEGTLAHTIGELILDEYLFNKLGCYEANWAAMFQFLGGTLKTHQNRIVYRITLKCHPDFSLSYLSVFPYMMGIYPILYCRRSPAIFTLPLVDDKAESK